MTCLCTNTRNKYSFRLLCYKFKATNGSDNHLEPYLHWTHAEGKPRFICNKDHTVLMSEDEGYSLGIISIQVRYTSTSSFSEILCDNPTLFQQEPIKAPAEPEPGSAAEGYCLAVKSQSQGSFQANTVFRQKYFHFGAKLQSTRSLPCTQFVLFTSVH